MPVTKFRMAISVSYIILAIATSPAALEQGGTETVKVARLIEESVEADGKRVAIVGELIGDFMPRGDYGWLSVSEESTAVSVWTEKEKVPADTMLGAYGVEGDRVRVTGIMYRACAEHGGDLDIHAETIILIQRGELVAHPVDSSRLAAAIVLGIGGLWAFVLWRRHEATTEKGRNPRR